MSRAIATCGPKDVTGGSGIRTFDLRDGRLIYLLESEKSKSQYCQSLVVDANLLLHDSLLYVTYFNPMS